MKSYIQLQNSNRFDLPPKFQDDDVRYSESLVEYFLTEFSQEDDVIFDPFAGYGTTLLVAEAMGRTAFGIEFDEQRGQYIRAKLKHPANLIIGDSRQLLSYNLPAFDLSITSPPYMGKDDEEDPLMAYTAPGQGYRSYLRDIQNIYAQVKQKMNPGGRVIIEVANLKHADGVTTLAWDMAGVVSEVLRFEGEIVVCWDNYGSGYEHSYCLLYTNRS